jgi:hypothetical protein
MRKTLSTYDRMMKNKKFKMAFDKSFKEFVLSEIKIARTQENSNSQPLLKYYHSLIGRNIT